jgi:EAL domain-containing protein (putative c-di-GMP-specific phosphodiesterase class I)
MRHHPPSMTLEMEITETAVMENAESSVKTLAQLKELGLSVAVDDFGIGYSSLAYLKRFPVDRLKIDQTFVRGIAEGSDDAAIVNAITMLAHSLDIEVVAEGVETEQQLGFVNGSRCDEVQGYLFSHAVYPDEVPELVRRWLPVGAPLVQEY